MLKENKMARYRVDVERTAFHTFEVEASSKKEAERLAEQLAYDMDWARSDADYKFGAATRIKGE